MNDDKSIPGMELLSKFPDLSLGIGGQLGAQDFSLRAMEALVAALGHPEREYPSLHVAGTNGKGSVLTFCAAALTAQGYRVGQYTSPHLANPFEGIRVDGQRINSDEAATLLQEMRASIETLQALTQFEIVTALAFLHFAKQQVDVAVVEVGLGGSLDATNVLSPLVSVITPIDLEHQSILGATLAEIAAHKAGIIKLDTPLALAPQPEEARDVILAQAVEKKAAVLEVGADLQVQRISFDLSGQRFRLIADGESAELEIAMHGAHQMENAALTFAALKLANSRGLALTEAAIRKGFAAARWPRRFEVLETQPAVVLDAAHTPAAAQTLAATLNELLPHQKVHALMGISADKDPNELITSIRSRLRSLSATQSKHPRAMDAHQLHSALLDLGVASEPFSDPEQALGAAIEKCSDDEIILVFGSVFLVEQLRPYLLGRERAAAQS